MKIYRRHVKACSEDSRKAADCACPLWADWRWAGKRELTALGTTDRKTANANFRKLMQDGPAALRPAKTPKPAESEVKRHDYAEYVESFLASLEQAGLHEDTVHNYRIILDALGTSKDRYVGITYLDEIDRAKLEAFQATRKGRSGGPQALETKRNELTTLGAFLEYCGDHGLPVKNHAKPMKKSLKHLAARECTGPFADDETDRILTVAQGTTRTLIKLILTTGMRISDAVSLRRDEIVGTTLRRKMKKSRFKNEVIVPLADYPALLAELEALPRCDKQGLYFFYDGPNHTLQSSSRLVKNAVQHWRHKMERVFTAAHVQDAHPHKLRDTFCINWLRAGKDIYTISLLLGHRSVAITQRYYGKYVPSMESRLAEGMKPVKNAPGPKLLRTA